MGMFGPAAPTYEVIRLAPEDKHRCKLPGWLDRRALRVKPGARVRCKECEQVWEWRDEGGIYDAWYLWTRIGPDGKPIYPIASADPVEGGDG